MRRHLLLIVLVVLGTSCNLADDAPPTSAHGDSGNDATDVTTDTTSIDDSTTTDDTDDRDIDPGATDTSGDADIRTDAEACTAREEFCSTTCIDTKTNPDHCGGCNQRCRPPANAVTEACADGDCVYACEEGHFDLNGNIDQPGEDGCEADCAPTNGGVEACDSIDNNCNGTVDEGCECTPGDSRDCGNDEGLCEAGTQECGDNGQWGSCQGDIGPASEVCDGQDNDCDGMTDENLTRSCGTDTGACSAGTESCSGGQWGSCQGATGPESEVCDGQDNDCDGQTDENLTRSCGINQGICSTGTETCSGGQWGSCTGTQPETEVCDGQDNDCDGMTDEGVTVYYLDEDGDGYGTSDSQCYSSGNYTATQSGDCNDESEYACPGCENIYCADTLDYDCDGVVGCADNDCSTGDACYGNSQFGTCSGGTCVP